MVSSIIYSVVSRRELFIVSFTKCTYPLSGKGKKIGYVIFGAEITVGWGKR